MLSTEQIWYRSRLQGEVWRKVKELVSLRDEYICSIKKCGAKRNLEYHHLCYSNMGTVFEVDDVLILCHAHHTKCHFKNRKKIPLTREALTKRYREVQRMWWLNLRPSDLFDLISRLITN